MRLNLINNEKRIDACIERNKAFTYFGIDWAMYEYARIDAEMTQALYSKEEIREAFEYPEMKSYEIKCTFELPKNS